MGGFSLGGGAGGLGAVEMSVFLMMLEEPWQLPGGLGIPVAAGGRALIAGEGSWGALLESPEEGALGLLGREGNLWYLAPLVTPLKMPCYFM